MARAIGAGNENPGTRMDPRRYLGEIIQPILGQ
jgi:hypothetical protein